MYKLFINNKHVYLCQNPAHVENLMYNDYIIEPYTNYENLKTTINVLLNHKNNHHVVLFYKDTDKLLEEVCSFFNCIEAAGGIVQNEYAEILLIHRRGFWDLPKGKIEKYESIQEAAIREVKEETGLKQVQIVHPIIFSKCRNKATYHSYELNGKQCLKISYWFEMHTTKHQPLIPQSEEDIEQVIWVSKNELPNYFDNMYSNIIDVLKEIK